MGSNNTYTYKINKEGSADKMCYSCEDNRDIIKGFCCVCDQTGEEKYVCIDCLDCYTSYDSSLNVYDTDWTLRKNLIKLRGYHCKTDGVFFITAKSGQSYRLAPIT